MKFESPGSCLLEDVIMLVTSVWFFHGVTLVKVRSLTQVTAGLSRNRGQLAFGFILTCQFPPNAHLYTQFLGPQFPCGFPLELEMQDRGVQGQQLGAGQSTLWGRLATYHPAEGSSA